MEITVFKKTEKKKNMEFHFLRLETRQTEMCNWEYVRWNIYMMTRVVTAMHAKYVS